jgi:hypothetical protein
MVCNRFVRVVVVVELLLSLSCHWRNGRGRFERSRYRHRDEICRRKGVVVGVVAVVVGVVVVVVVEAVVVEDVVVGVVVVVVVEAVVVEDVVS